MVQAFAGPEDKGFVDQQTLVNLADLGPRRRHLQATRHAYVHVLLAAAANKLHAKAFLC